MSNKVTKTSMQNKNNDLPLYLFHQGTNYSAYEYMGAHFVSKDNKQGVVFRVWAPNADSVSVVGDFNGWNENFNVMTRVSSSGVFEIFIEGLAEFDAYKYAIKRNDNVTLKADPYAFHSETPSGTASKIYDINGYKWKDEEFIKNRKPVYDRPVNIYEVNLSSWKRHENGDYYTYRELAKELVSYVVKMGYTHIELMPISEYPFDGSWGYQITGYYSISSRFGTPKDFMCFVDCCHRAGISVILDWVPGHFPKDLHGLYEFDGSPCYESSCWAKKEHKTWGTRLFDWGRNEVQSFLVSNAVYLMDKFHIDGLRVDAVASMLYLDYDRKQGEWIPNEQGGNYNLEAIAFFKKLNTVIFSKFPCAIMAAEESTSFPMVTKPVDCGGLGFNFKWNMGWMNDVLKYVELDPYFRSANHDKLTFSMYYAFSENFILPISHDEVVHGKKSLLDKMNGNLEDKFSTLRTFMMYMFAHPGKKLSFMGNEFGQFREWDFSNGLEFFMLRYDNHNKLNKFNKRLNHLYKTTSPLFEIEDSWDGFSWVSVDERDNNVLAFKRINKKGEELFALFNFSGVDFPRYYIGAEKGEYKAVLCSDDKRYGGQGRQRRKTIKAVKKPAHDKQYSILVKLPKLSGIYFVKTNNIF